MRIKTSVSIRGPWGAPPQVEGVRKRVTTLRLRCKKRGFVELAASTKGAPRHNLEFATEKGTPHHDQYVNVDSLGLEEKKKTSGTKKRKSSGPRSRS